MAHALLVDLIGWTRTEEWITPAPEPEDVRQTWGLTPEAQAGKAALDAMARGQ